MTDASPSFGALVVLCGLPGVGKSTVATTLVDELGGTHLQSDEVRKELFEEPQYDPEEDAATYEELFDRAATALERGEHVVLDATFSDSDKREAAADIAWRAGTEFRLLKVEADEAVVRERLAERSGDVSDAGHRAYAEKKEAFDPVPEDVTVVDNSGNVSTTQRAVRQWVQRSLKSRQRKGRGQGF